jgi:hypothetical protein
LKGGRYSRSWGEDFEKQNLFRAAVPKGEKDADAAWDRKSTNHGMEEKLTE